MEYKDKKQIKVLQITHGLAPGGIESFVLNLFDNIDRDKIDMRFAIACDGKQHHEDKVLKQGGIIYRTNDLDGLINMTRHFFKLIKLIKKEGPFDVVHSHIDFFNGVNLLASFIAGVKIRISHSHNTNSANTEHREPSFIVKMYRFIMRSLINLFSTDRLGCCKEANLYMYGKKLGNESNSLVIYNAVDLNKFNKEKYTGCRELNIDRNKINMITIGRICEQKNSLFIPKIIKELNNLRDDIHLYWVGEGPQEDQVKNIINEYDLNEKITLLGVRKDISELLSNMDFMIFPSKWEGLPVTLVETQVSKVPCFLSDLITREVDMGLCNYISLEYSEKQWAEVINTYINNNAYSNKIDNDKLKKFDIKNMSKKVEDIYTSRRRTTSEEVAI